VRLADRNTAGLELITFYGRCGLYSCSLFGIQVGGIDYDKPVCASDLKTANATETLFETIYENSPRLSHKGTLDDGTIRGKDITKY
jgi:hypothetical protein